MNEKQLDNAIHELINILDNVDMGKREISDQIDDLKATLEQEE